MTPTKTRCIKSFLKSEGLNYNDPQREKIKNMNSKEIVSVLKQTNSKMNKHIKSSKKIQRGIRKFGRRNNTRVRFNSSDSIDPDGREYRRRKKLRKKEKIGKDINKLLVDYTFKYGDIQTAIEKIAEKQKRDMGRAGRSIDPYRILQKMIRRSGYQKRSREDYIQSLKKMLRPTRRSIKRQHSSNVYRKQRDDFGSGLINRNNPEELFKFLKSEERRNREKLGINQNDSVKKEKENINEQQINVEELKKLIQSGNFVGITNLFIYILQIIQ